jgi:tetratricopeptide (TPR) repeat protein
MTPPDPDEFVSMEELRAGLIQLMHRGDRAVAAATSLSKSTVSRLRNGTGPVTETSVKALIRGYAPQDLERWLAAWNRLNRPRDDVWGALLPPDVPSFTGRRGQLAVFDRAVVAMRRRPNETHLVTVSGMGGIGKTALVVHWAHQVVESFPDGCLFVDLRGYDADRPLTAAGALATLLRELGASGADIPAGTRERAEAFHRLLAGRRMLVVLDNAHDAAQVQLLLPRANGCLAVVTSRDDLMPLHARHGAQAIKLGVLPRRAARSLLRAVAGRRTGPESSIIIECCAGVPLALRIAGTLAADSSLAEVGQLVRELAADQRPLELFDAGGADAAVRAVFSRSYAHLHSDAARVFRLLALHPGREIDRYAVAALAGSDLPEARRCLETLRHATLVTEQRPRRFSMHDLLRAYAREIAELAAHRSDGSAAQDRLFDYYLAAAVAASGVFYPHGRVLDWEVPVPGTALPSLADPGATRRWLDAERANLVDTVGYAARIGRADVACRLADAIWMYLHSGAHYAEAVTVHNQAAQAAHAAHAAHASGARADEANALDHLGVAHLHLGSYPEALRCLRAALAIHQETGDRIRQGRTLSHLGTVHARCGDYLAAAEALLAGLAVARQAMDHIGERNVVTNLGLVYQQAGRYGDALPHVEEAVRLAGTVANPASLAIALNNRGLVHHRLRHYDEALEDITRALAVARAAGVRNLEAEALDSLGCVLHGLGRTGEAQAHFDDAVRIHRQVGDRTAEAGTLDNLGRVLLQQHPAEALGHHQRALSLAHDVGDRARITSASNGCGDAYRALGRYGEARSQYENALALAHRTGNGDQEARALDGIAHVAYAEDHLEEARAAWRAAADRYAELELPEAADIERRLRDLPVNPAGPVGCSGPSPMRRGN